jgi:hypothetical protein
MPVTLGAYHSHLLLRQPIRIIPEDSLSDALEMLATIDVSDEELADRGVRLSEHDVVIDGLGPSTFTLIELQSREQYLLHRLEHRPETLNVHAPLTADPRALLGTLLSALDLAPDRVKWTEADEYWTKLVEEYDREKWLKQRRRLG